MKMTTKAIVIVVPRGRNRVVPELLAHKPNFFSPNFLLQTGRSYTSPYIDVVRAKIILYAAEGLTNKEIGARLDTPRQIVSKWRKRFFDQRLAGLQEQPRRGRPGLFSPLRRHRR